MSKIITQLKPLDPSKNSEQKDPKGRIIKEVKSITIGKTWISFDNIKWNLPVTTMSRLQSHLTHLGISFEYVNLSDHSTPAYEVSDYYIRDYWLEVHIRMGANETYFVLKRYLNKYLSDYMGIHVLQQNIKHSEVINILIKNSRFYWQMPNNVVYYVPLNKIPAQTFINEIALQTLDIKNATEAKFPVYFYFVIRKNIYLCIDILGKNRLFSLPIKYRQEHTGDIFKCLFARDIRDFDNVWLCNNFPMINNYELLHEIESNVTAKITKADVYMVHNNFVDEDKIYRSIFVYKNCRYKMPIIIEQYLMSEVKSGVMSAWQKNQIYQMEPVIYYNNGINIKFNTPSGYVVLLIEIQKTMWAAKMLQLCLMLYIGTKHNSLFQHKQQHLSCE